MYVLLFKINGQIDSVDSTSDSKDKLKQFAADNFNNGKPYKWSKYDVAKCGGVEDGEYEIIMVDHVL